MEYFEGQKSARTLFQMPKDIRRAILGAAYEFQDYTFIWKIDENDTVPEMTNLFTASWIPQSALLAHPNMRCFVSHGGMNSVLELARNGRPSILIPLFGDQHRNAKLVERRGSAIVIYKEFFTVEIFIKSLRTILEDKLYRQKAERLSSLMRRKPFNLKERLLSTVEFSAIHGKIEELDIYSYRMGTLQYFCLDIIFVIFALVALQFFACAYGIRKFLKLVLYHKNKTD
ncbi:glycosyltransferase family 28 protein [Teladorsagia circumcincta]|uniref:glucuronosyltransferase n=1 Tax=Teladorsagia circumcincta TaxID=45464 RepID=A0A2G9TNV5_TELCI|nr:glycosyltransferase family 28 protein [Teladorsagia circumcincta]